MKKITIAIDGYSSCGKSTLAKDLATALGYTYIDTGAMYRAVSLYFLNKGIITEQGDFVYQAKDFIHEIDIDFKFDNDQRKSIICLNKKNVEGEIRNLRVSRVVSQVSTIKEVRQKLVALQQKMGENKGVVMDGRDIGTVVFPDAEIKIFMLADTDVRTNRRYEELKSKGQEISMDKVKYNLQERDRIDTSREVSPLTQADDAIIIDNSEMDIEKQLGYALHICKAEIFNINNPDLIEEN